MKNLLLNIFLCSIFLLLNINHTNLLISSSNNYSITTIDTIKSDIIKWRYKVIDGKVYKRQFNHSKKIWLGNWIKM